MIKAVFLALLFAALGAATATAAAAPSQVKGLFVGINHYVGADPGVSFDLKGPVNDVRLMQATLRDKGLLRADPFDATAATCPNVRDKPVTTSVTLVDGCATRQVIFDAWRALIRSTRPGDTLLFYYSGHGSHTAEGDEAEGGQAVSTLVPTDARGPHGAGDLTGVQVRMLIDAATERGRNVVTIFDSCESGTATRDLDHPTAGGAREIPPAAGDAAPGGDPDFSDLREPRTGAGYRVHLAAARRQEIARESYWGGEGDSARFDGQSAQDGDVRHGDFTMALAAAIKAHESAVYYDLAVAAEQWLDSKWSAGRPDPGLARQHPQAEGVALLGVFLQSGADAGRIYLARWNGDKLVALDQDVEVGPAGGVTAGSRFAVFSSAGDALRGGEPLGQATVDPTVDPFHALLTPAPISPSARGAKTLWLREQAHVFAAANLKVALTGGAGDRRDRVQAALAEMHAVTFVDPSQAEFELALGDGDHAALWKVQGGQRGPRAVDIDKVAADTLEARIAEALRRVANHRQLLALPTTAREPFGAIWLQSPCDATGATSDCTPNIFGRSAAGGPPRAPLPEGSCAAGALAGHESQTRAQAGAANVPRGEKFVIYVRNVSCRTLHPYVFYLGADYSVTLLYPPPFAADKILARKDQLVRSGTARLPTPLTGTEPGHVLLIMSDTPIPAEVLQQSGLPKGIGCEGSALAHLLCAARTGSRDVAANVDSLGRWGVSTVSVYVTEPARP